jgi:phosphoglycerate dehydrogenase-like enzyme
MPTPSITPGAPWPALRPLAVLCAVEPALASFEAARQAAALAAGGTLALVAVRLRDDRSAEAHLAAARFVAAREGATPAEAVLAGADPLAALLAATAAYDALVVVDRRDDGTPGRLVDAALRRAPCSVLVARRLPHGRRLGDAIAFATGPARLGSAQGTGATLVVVAGEDPLRAADVARRASCPVLVARPAAGPGPVERADPAEPAGAAIGGLAAR